MFENTFPIARPSIGADDGRGQTDREWRVLHRPHIHTRLEATERDGGKSMSVLVPVMVLPENT